MADAPHLGVFALVRVDYATFTLIDIDVDMPERIGPVRAEEHATVAIFTGINSGPVRVAVDPRTVPPPAADLDSGLQEWDEIVEFSGESPDGSVEVVSLTEGLVAELLPLSATGPGSYRLRVHARGRATHRDLAVNEPVEDYLITAWPAPQAPAVVHRTAAGTNLLPRREADLPALQPHLHPPADPRPRPPSPRSGVRSRSATTRPSAFPPSLGGELSPPRGGTVRRR
jgi:hypothetical protein